MQYRSVGLVLAALALAAPLSALNNRSAVSIAGLDSNPCTPASPCRSFGAAMLATAATGEIIALDTAGYGPFTIDRAVTVSGAAGVHAAITTTSGDGITVNAAGAQVLVRNLVLVGPGGANAIHGAAATELRIVHCFIHGFTANGVLIDGAVGDASVDASDILDNGASNGVSVTTSSGIVHATVTNSKIEGSLNGVVAGQNSEVIVANSTITGCTTGAQASSVTGSGALHADLMLESCVIAFNANGASANVFGGNNTATVTISQNLFAFNPLGVASGGGVVLSFANNRFMGNGIDGDPFAPATFK